MYIELVNRDELLEKCEKVEKLMREASDILRLLPFSMKYEVREGNREEESIDSAPDNQ